MKPIYLTEEEAKMPFDEIVASVRSDLSRLRGKLQDLERLHPPWRERVSHATGGITCVVAALYAGQIEYENWRKKQEPTT